MARSPIEAYQLDPEEQRLMVRWEMHIDRVLTEHGVSPDHGSYVSFTGPIGDAVVNILIGKYQAAGWAFVTPIRGESGGIITGLSFR